jgi:hypothetical protein
VPGGTVTAAGLVPLELSVMVVLLVGGPPGSLGPLGDDPPQFTINVTTAAVMMSRRRRIVHNANACSFGMLDRMRCPFRPSGSVNPYEIGKEFVENHQKIRGF